jgi:UrcA family protein
MNTRPIEAQRWARRRTAVGVALLMALFGIVPVRATADRRATTTISHAAKVPLCGNLTGQRDLAGRPSSADDGNPTRSMVVEYRDLNLTVAEGVSTLYRRLKLAAREVCKTPDGGYGDPVVWLHCYHDALVGAVRDLGNDRVTALYNREHTTAIPPPTAKSTP